MQSLASGATYEWGMDSPSPPPQGETLHIHVLSLTETHVVTTVRTSSVFPGWRMKETRLWDRLLQILGHSRRCLSDLTLTCFQRQSCFPYGSFCAGKGCCFINDQPALPGSAGLLVLRLRQMAPGNFDRNEDRPDKEEVALESLGVFHRAGAQCILARGGRGVIHATSSMITFPSVEGSQESFRAS